MWNNRSFKITIFTKFYHFRPNLVKLISIAKYICNSCYNTTTLWINASWFCMYFERMSFQTLSSWNSTQKHIQILWCTPGTHEPHHHLWISCFNFFKSLYYIWQVLLNNSHISCLLVNLVYLMIWATGIILILYWKHCEQWLYFFIHPQEQDLMNACSSEHTL